MCPKVLIWLTEGSRGWIGQVPEAGIARHKQLTQPLARASHPYDTVLGRVPGLDGYHSTGGRPNAEMIPGLILYRFGAALLFFNSDYFKSRVRAIVHAAETPPRWFVLDAGMMPIVDTTGAAVLGEVREELGRSGIEFVLAEARAPVRAMLERTGLDEQIGRDRMFPTIETAVAGLTSTTTAAGVADWRN